MAEKAQIENHVKNHSPFGCNPKVQGGAIRCGSANRTGAVPQECLPGVLEHKEFTRVSIDLGRCTLCGEGRAVFRSADGRTRLCEGCYGRLVRAWNVQKGIA